MAPFRSYEHLLRLAALFAAGAALFLGVRWLLVPADYGLLGPFRAGAIAQVQATPVVYAGQRACVECHADVGDLRKGNAHERISCESCHGPHATHAQDPSVAALRPDPRATCARCHLPDAARPAGFKTVVFEDHADAGACTACHPAHAPRF
jgi:hypothetical protein